jgi:tetratricopeptide (TPR) repeat protein
MAGGAVPMQSSFLLSGLETRYPAQISARIIAALRHDPLVWSALEDEDFYQRAMEAERGAPSFWTPANLGLVLMGAGLHADTLAGSGMPGIDTEIRQQALRAYEDAARCATPPATLREAVLLALALRERRRSIGNWNGLANELIFNRQDGARVSVRTWNTVLAVLVGLIPDPDELLLALLAYRDVNIAAEWILHVILTMPVDEAEQARQLSTLLTDSPAERQLDVLKTIQAHGRKDLTARVSTMLLNGHPLFSTFKMKTDFDQVSAENLANRAIVLQQLALFNQLAGSPAQAEACLKMAKATLKYLQAGLDIQMLDTTMVAGVTQPSLEELANITSNLPPSDRLSSEVAWIIPAAVDVVADIDRVEYGSDNPLILLRKALKCQSNGDCRIAKELGIRAAGALIDQLEVSPKPFMGEFYVHWDGNSFLDGLIELDLLDEAEKCARAFLTFRPTDPVLLGRHADLLSARGKFRKAKDQRRLAVALIPNSVELRRKLAETDEEAGDWGEAFLHRKSILEIDDNGSVEDRLSFARAGIRSGKIDQAIEMCAQILAKDDENPTAHGLCGVAYEKIANVPEAIEHLRKATMIDPEQAEWWLALAEIYRKNAGQRQAVDTLRAAVMAAPYCGRLFMGLGEMLLEEGLSSEALPYLRRAHDLVPDDETIGLRLSKALHKLGHADEARYVMERMRGKWSLRPHLAFEFADLSCKLGDWEGAIPAFEVAVRSDDPKADWLVAYSSLLLDDRLAKGLDEVRGGMRFSQAEKFLTEALEKSPENLEARIMMAEALRKQGFYDQALGRYQALAEEPSSILPEQLLRVQHGLGITALELNLNDAALASIRDAAMRRPGDLVLQHDLARAYMQAELPHEAARVAEEALDLAVNDLDNLDWFAGMMTKLGKPERAEEALRVAVELGPDNPDMRLRLAHVQLMNGNVGGVHATLDQILSEKNVDSEALRQCAYLYLRMEDLPAAQSCLERASNAIRNPDPSLLYDLAKLYDQSGDLQNALETMQKATMEVVKDARIHFYYAQLLGRTSQWTAARSSLEKALEITQAEGGDKQWSLETQIFRELASELYRCGDIAAALEYAQKALERLPEDGELRAEAAEMANTVLQFDLSRSIAMSPAEQGENTLRKTVKQALLIAEAALECNDLLAAVAAWEEAVGAVEWKAWQTAVEARLDARGGDWVRAEEGARKAVAQALASEEHERSQLIWSGKAAIEAGLWDDGFNILETYYEEKPNDPRGPYELGKAFILAAERAQDCRLLNCIAHSPGEELLSETTYDRYKSLMEQAIIMTQSQDAIRWMARGELAFVKHLDTVKEFGRYKNNGNDIAGVVRALRNNEQWPSAVLAAQQALEDVEVQFQLGLGYLDEDPEKGLEMISALLDKLPRQPLMRRRASLLALKSTRIEQAFNYLEESLACWPDEPIWQAEAAELADQIGNLAKVASHWKTAAHLSPANSTYALSLGQTYARLGRYDEAVEALDRAARLVPDHLTAWLELAEAAKMAGMLSHAMDAAQKAIEIGEGDVRGVLLTSEIAREMGDAASAAEYARLALRREPANPKAVLALSQSMTQLGAENEALAVIEEKLSEVTPSFSLLLERARLVYRLKGALGASGLFVKLAQSNPESSDVLAMLAKIQLEAGDKKGAELSALKSLRLNPEQPELSMMLGSIERELGQLDQAVFYLSEAVRLQPHNAEGYLELGQAYLDRREHGAALQAFRGAIQSNPGDKRGYSQAAAIFKDSKDYLSAEKMLQHAANLDPDDLQIRRQLIAVMALNLIHKSQEANSPV